MIEYRVVQDTITNRISIRLVRTTEQGDVEFISDQPEQLVSNNLDDLTSLCIHTQSALTKPVLTWTIANPVDSAVDIMNRGKHDQ